MKVGDLVRMKYMMYWAAKANQHIHYTSTPGIVTCGIVPDRGPYQMITVVIAGRIYHGMAAEFELVNESRRSS